MRMLLVLAAISLSSAAACATQLTFNQARIELTPGPSDGTVSATFRFAVGGVDAVRVSTKTSCTCLTATLDRDAYRPGERGVIVADFAIGTLVGEQVKTISVITDPPSEAPVELTVAAHLPGPKLDRTQVTWAVGEERAIKKVTITLPADGSFTILDAVSRTGAFLPAIDPTDKPNVFVLGLQPFKNSTPIDDAIDIVTRPTSYTVVYAHVVAEPAAPKR